MLKEVEEVSLMLEKLLKMILSGHIIGLSQKGNFLEIWNQDKLMFHLII